MLVFAGIAQIFAPLIDVFQAILKFFHDSGGFSWGLSIVLLTIAVRAVLVPLTFRQIKGMVRMQALQPQMKEIQQKYKQDKQRQQQEIMKFYRENKVNPLASCLPMVLQLPVFFALYYMLRDTLRRDICPEIQKHYQHLYALHHHVSQAAALGQTTACGHSAASHFLFISDLTAKGTGVELVILILLYVGSQLGSTLVMSASSSMDPTQRKIMMFMPIVFVLFVIRFPAGLMLYWITTNLWTVTQQYVVRRYVGPTVAVAGGGGADDDGGSGVVTARGGPSGSGGSSGSGGIGGLGGFGERMRERLERAQSDGGTKRQGGGRRSEPETAAPAKSTGSAKSTGTAKSAGTAAKSTGSKSTATTKRPAQAKKGGGSSTNGSGSGGSTPPPRSPRKKKKRSGRRR